jgi:arsenical resistance protein ArsH
MASYLENGLTKVHHATSDGDLNNISVMRAADKPIRDPDYAYRSLAIPAISEDPELRQLYRPFLLEDSIQATDWISRLELATVTEMAEGDIKKTGERLRVLVLYGSLRKR